MNVLVGSACASVAWIVYVLALLQRGERSVWTVCMAIDCEEDQGTHKVNFGLHGSRNHTSALNWILQIARWVHACERESLFLCATVSLAMPSYCRYVCSIFNSLITLHTVRVPCCTSSSTQEKGYNDISVHLPLSFISPLSPLPLWVRVFNYQIKQDLQSAAHIIPPGFVVIEKQWLFLCHRYHSGSRCVW